MDRLLSFAMAVVIAIVATKLDLNYAGLAILAGIAIAMAAYFKGDDTFFSLEFGAFFALVGLVALAFAYYVCKQHGISFETLDHVKSLPTLVRRMPYFGVAFLALGGAVTAISSLRKG